MTWTVLAPCCAAGVAYILKLLDQYGNHDALHWLRSCKTHYANERVRIALAAPLSTLSLPVACTHTLTHTHTHTHTHTFPSTYTRSPSLFFSPLSGFSPSLLHSLSHALLCLSPPAQARVDKARAQSKDDEKLQDTLKFSLTRYEQHQLVRHAACLPAVVGCVSGEVVCGEVVL